MQERGPTQLLLWIYLTASPFIAQKLKSLPFSNFFALWKEPFLPILCTLKMAVDKVVKTRFSRIIFPSAAMQENLL